jgi:protein TonB
VQVLIDETGNVVSAKAIDGHVFFKSEAERAARRAKFKPTLLSNHPVKVTGVIVYRFTR